MSTSGQSGDAGEAGFSTVTPAVPASTVVQTNNNPYSVDIYILTAGTATGWSIVDARGTTTAISASTGPPVGSVIRLGPKEGIKITYSVVPTWVWKGVAPV